MRVVSPHVNVFMLASEPRPSEADRIQFEVRRRRVFVSRLAWIDSHGDIQVVAPPDKHSADTGFRAVPKLIVEVADGEGQEHISPDLCLDPKSKMVILEQEQPGEFEILEQINVFA